jgi:putative hemolysin
VRVRESEYERISVCVKRGGEREEERKKEGGEVWWRER